MQEEFHNVQISGKNARNISKKDFIYEESVTTLEMPDGFLCLFLEIRKKKPGKTIGDDSFSMQDFFSNLHKKIIKING